MKPIEKNKILYFYITEKGMKKNLKDSSLFQTEKDILRYLGKILVPCSIFNIKLKLGDGKIKNDWATIKKVLLNLNDEGLVGIR